MQNQLDQTFSALADPTRRQILERLARGAASVQELAEPFVMSLPAVSKHLKVLERAGLIRRHKDGRVHRINISADPLAEARNWLEAYRIFWTNQLDSLDDYLTSGTDNSD